MEVGNADAEVHRTHRVLVGVKNTLQEEAAAVELGYSLGELEEWRRGLRWSMAGHHTVVVRMGLESSKLGKDCIHRCNVYVVLRLPEQNAFINKIHQKPMRFPPYLSRIARHGGK